MVMMIAENNCEFSHDIQIDRHFDFISGLLVNCHENVLTVWHTRAKKLLTGCEKVVPDDDGQLHHTVITA